MTKEAFPDEKMFAISSVPRFADFVDYLVSNVVPKDYSPHAKKRFLHDVNKYYWDEPYLFRFCADNVIRRCVFEEQKHGILEICHASPYGGHYKGDRTAAKVLQSGFCWPTLFKDAYRFAMGCDHFQRTGNLSKRDEMPLKPILKVELFDVWGTDFMGPFVYSFGKYYILLMIDYVSKWVEACATSTNDAKTVLEFMKKNIFTRFRVQG